MIRKVIIILSIVLLIITGGYIFIKFYFLKVKDFKPDTSKDKSIIDLRPAIIAKLQQLVKDGSDGLYTLSIEKINPDVLASTLDIINASLHIDTTVMLQLGKQKELPDDIFKIHFDSLHIDGIGFDYLFHTRRVNITRINISNPLIEVYHKQLANNKALRARNDTLSFYTRIREEMNKITIGNINVDKGTLIIYRAPQNKNITRFNDVAIKIKDVLVDSSTQFDATRFLFAKHATIDAKNYIIPTADSLYYFKTGAISISAELHKLTLLNVELNARGNRKQFENKLHYRKDRYHFAFPRVTLYNVDWWALMNHDKFISKKTVIMGGVFTTFLDRSLPANPAPPVDNFPHQLLMKVPIPVSVGNIKLQHVNVSYEEYSPEAKRSSTAFFDNINGRLNYVSNIPADIKKHPVANFSGRGLFMHHTPMKVRFTFNLSKYKTGDFTADVSMDTLDNGTINPLAQPLGLFSVKSGKMQHATAHIEGNNFKAKCKIAISYTGLHIQPLKKANENGQLKKKRITSVIANAFFIKNDNPEKGKELRKPDYSVERDHHGNFFNMIWTTVLTGILKTVGIPVKLGMH